MYYRDLVLFVLGITSFVLYKYRIVKELDDLYTLLVSEAEVISRFHKEYEELNVWLTDTKGMLEVTGSPTTPGLMGVPASPAQLRGKHQVSSYN